MVLTSEQQLILALMRGALGHPEKPMPVQNINWQAWLQQLSMHQLSALALEGALANGQHLPEQLMALLSNEATSYAFGMYAKINIQNDLLEQFQRADIHPVVLKGLSLCALYPKEECRPFSDLDILVSDPVEHQRACRMLQQLGAVKEQDDFTDYHTGYALPTDTGGIKVELHERLISSYGIKKFDQAVERIFTQALPSIAPCASIFGIQMPVLPVTLNALYLLMHMFQHFMSKGFGLRLFCDWTVFCRAMHDQVDRATLRQWLCELKLMGFYSAVTKICIDHLGLAESERLLPCEAGRELADDLLQDVLEGGEFGKNDKNRMVITSRKAGVRAYLL